MEVITQPWPWYVAGPAIALVLFLMNYFGKSFGVSTNLETFCTIGGAGKFVDYFNTDWCRSRDLRIVQTDRITC